MSSVRSTVWSSSRPSLLCALLLSALLSVPGATTAHAASQGLTVRAMVPALLDVQPGSTVTASFAVANRNGRRVEVLENVAVPQGWRLIVGGSTFGLSAGEERLRLVTFQAPLTTPAGSYVLAYDATGQGDTDLYCRGEVEIAVLPLGRVELIEREARAKVIAGDTLEVSISVVNHSNAESEILVSFASSETYPANIDASSFVLGVAESRDITISVETPRELQRRVTHVLTVEAAASVSDAGEATARSAVVQEIIPRVTGPRDPYHRIPTALRATYVGGDEGAGVQLEFSGRGGLNEDGGHRLGFVLRGPDTRGDSAFGIREEYGLGFHGEGYNVQLGDGVYGLSRLTGQRRYARGASVELARGMWDAGVSYFGARPGEAEAEKGMGRLRFRPTERASLGLNYVRTQAGGAVLGVEATSKIAQWLEIDAEYARQADLSGQRAYWARVRGVGGSARYFLERIRAEEGFPGRYSDEHHTAASISFPVLWELRLNAFYRDYESRDVGDLLESEDGETIVSSTTREEARSLGFRRSLWSWLRATADYREVHREGRTATTPFNYRTRTTRVAVEFARKMANAVASVELGRLDDLAAGATSDATRYGLTVSLRPDRHWHLSGHFKSALSGSPDPSSRSDAAGLRAEVTTADCLSLAVGVQWRGFVGDAGIEPDEVTAGAAYTLPCRHRISGELRWRRFDDERAPEKNFRVGYEIPIEAPIGPRTSTGSVRGKVSDTGDPRGPGLEDAVLLLNGRTAVTDHRGEYLFPSLEPGEYYLAVDPASIGTHRVPAVELPRKIEVAGGEESRFDLGVARPGRLEGQVLLNEPIDDPPDDSAEGGDVTASPAPPPLLVEIACGDQVLRQMTDSKGLFSFDRLRPGRWILTIHSEALPRFHTLDVDTFVVDVLPGATERVTATIRPSTETIPIIETGDVRTSGLPR